MSDPFEYRQASHLRFEPQGWRPSKTQIAIAIVVVLAAAAGLVPPLVWFLSSGGNCPAPLRRDAVAWLQRVEGRLPGKGVVLRGGCDTEATLAGLIIDADPVETSQAMGHLGCHPPTAWQWWRGEQECDVRLDHGTVVAEVWERPRRGNVTVTLHQ